MDTITAIKERRAVKHYDANHEITQAELDEIIDVAAQAPSSFNIQHWRLVNVTDKGLRAKIRAAAVDQAQVTDASLLFVLCADVKAWDKEPAKYWRNAPKEAQDMLVPWMGEFYRGNEQLQRDEALRSVGLIAQTIMLFVKAMGYDSCPMIGFDPDKVGELINLPDDHIIGMMITIGKAVKPAFDKPGFIEKSEMLVENSF